MNTLHAILKPKSSHVFIASWIKSPEVSGLNFGSCISYHFPAKRPISSFLLSPYFSFLNDLLMWDFIQLIKISTGENSGEYGTVWTSVISKSFTLFLTSLVEWYRAPSQVIMNALFLSPYLVDSRLSSSSMNAVNTVPFVFLSLIAQSSNASSLIAAITEYLFWRLLQNGKSWNSLCSPYPCWAGRPGYRKFIDLKNLESYLACSFDEAYVVSSMTCYFRTQNL